MKDTWLGPIGTAIAGVLILLATTGCSVLPVMRKTVANDINAIIDKHDCASTCDEWKVALKAYLATKFGL